MLELVVTGTMIHFRGCVNVDPTISRVYGDVTVNGKVAATRAYLFRLDGRTLKPLKTRGTSAILEGAKVRSPVTPLPC